MALFFREKGAWLLILFTTTLILLNGVVSINGLEYNTPYCLTNTTSQKTAIISSNISGTLKTYIINQSITCAFGCDDVTGKCNPDPFNSLLIGLGVLIVFIVIILIIARRFA